jgi:hypothetical protein
MCVMMCIHHTAIVMSISSLMGRTRSGGEQNFRILLLSALFPARVVTIEAHKRAATTFPRFSIDFPLSSRRWLV